VSYNVSNDVGIIESGIAFALTFIEIIFLSPHRKDFQVFPFIRNYFPISNANQLISYLGKTAVNDRD